MISVVYFEQDGRNVMVGAFLMRSDAQRFIDKTPFSEGYKLTEVDDWNSWSKIREGIA
jgi:hypothetical protein